MKWNNYQAPRRSMLCFLKPLMFNADLTLRWKGSFLKERIGQLQVQKFADVKRMAQWKVGGCLWWREWRNQAKNKFFQLLNYAKLNLWEDVGNSEPQIPTKSAAFSLGFTTCQIIRYPIFLLITEIRRTRCRRRRKLAAERSRSLLNRLHFSRTYICNVVVV